MKYPKAKRLPSGSWNCRVRVNGQDISITRPTEKEAVAEAMVIKAGIKDMSKEESLNRKNMTVSQVIDEYIMVRKNLLSPSTINGYREIQRTRFQQVQNKKLNELTAAKWQSIVNAEARLCSPKTLKNAWGLISAAIYDINGQRIAIRLPQLQDKDLSFLTPDQIPIFVAAIKGKSFEIPALLALSGLRRSEILGLRWENIDVNALTIKITGAAVIGEGNKLQYKQTNKNRFSKRTIPIIPPLLDAISSRPHPDEGLVHSAAPTTLYSQINKVCRELGLPEVGVHGLRRSFASLAYHLKLSEEVTMRIGGWSDIYTMRKIYTKISERDIASQSACLQHFFGRNDNENGNVEQIDS